MVIFYSYVSLPEGTINIITILVRWKPVPSLGGWRKQCCTSKNVSQLCHGSEDGTCGMVISPSLLKNRPRGRGPLNGGNGFFMQSGTNQGFHRCSKVFHGFHKDSPANPATPAKSALCPLTDPKQLSKTWWETNEERPLKSRTPLATLGRSPA